MRVGRLGIAVAAVAAVVVLPAPTFAEPVYLRCTDGEPRCDADRSCNGSCTFALRRVDGSRFPDFELLTLSDHAKRHVTVALRGNGTKPGRKVRYAYATRGDRRRKFILLCLPRTVACPRLCTGTLNGQPVQCLAYGLLNDFGDPIAVGFYLKSGALEGGGDVSSVPGRSLNGDLMLEDAAHPGGRAFWAGSGFPGSVVEYVVTDQADVSSIGWLVEVHGTLDSTFVADDGETVHVELEF